MARFLIFTVCFGLLINPLFAAEQAPAEKQFSPDVRHQQFRDQIVNYVRDFAFSQPDKAPIDALNQLEEDWDNSYQNTHWKIQITAYYEGENVGEGRSSGKDLTDTLRKATQLTMRNQDIASISDPENYHFKVNFDYHPSEAYTLVDYENKGLEMQGNRVTVRHVDTDRLKQQITESKAYLLRNMNPDYHGFFKFYDANEDEREALLRTTYSATALYTFIKLYQYKKDLELESYFKDIAQFLLDRQVTEGPNAGGFDYGYNPDTQEDTCRIVVGTTSKTIFTLLLMHDLYPKQEQYLTAAQSAGDWLLTMINDDGNVTPIAECDKGDWEYKNKQSLLYTGQVLSALSRLYGQTQDDRYLDGAKAIAGLFLNKVASQGPILGDDYRPANSISSSWVMMSLIDLAKVDPAPVYFRTIDQIAEALLARQIDNKDDAFNYGRYLDAMTTSGNGWINEVMGEMYQFCRAEGVADCGPYQEAMRRTSRWLLQNAYNATNTFAVTNPQQAMGGFITNFNTQTVRTDAVCHGLNGLISLLHVEGKENKELVDLPERPLRELLPLLRAGEYN